jgi:hypothetical protein
MKNPKPVVQVLREGGTHPKKNAAEEVERTWLERRRMAARNGVFSRSKVHTRPETQRMSTFYGVNAERDMVAEWVPLASLPEHQQRPTLEWVARVGGTAVPQNVLVWRFREDFNPEVING